MPLCPQITNTPITVTQTADFTVSSVLPVVAATTTQVEDAIVLIDGKTKAYYQATAPTSGMTEGDIWFDTDDGNKQYYYTGTAWVSVQDTAIAAATSASAAATAAAAAAAEAAAEAEIAATAAQTTANGKNKIYRQTSAPTGTLVSGDLWFDTDDDNRIYRYDGSSWVANTLGNNALASISANKITAGTIDASVITVSNINAGNISTGTLAADRIAAASITGAKIAANTITASNITAGTITATEIAAGTITAAKIATGTITATQIASETITATQIAAGTITAAKIAAGTITATEIAAGTITTDKLVAGTLTGFTVQTSSGNDAIVLSGASNALGIKNSGTFAGWLLGIGSGAFMMHYGTTPSSTGYPRAQVSSTTASLAADGSNSISITTTGNNVQGATSFGANLTASAFLLNPGMATGTGTAVGILTGGRLVIGTSSERFKTNIKTIPAENWLDKVTQLRPITFQYDSAYSEEPEQVVAGLIAEDVEDIGGFEDVLLYDSVGDVFAVAYDRLSVYLILAIKELKAEINQLKGE